MLRRFKSSRRRAAAAAARFRPTFEQLEARQLLTAELGCTPLPLDPAAVEFSYPEGEGELAEIKIEAIGGISTSTGTGYKAQSKVWQHDGTWWAAIGGSGTKIWRLDGTKWTAVLTLSTTAYRADVKHDGDLVHVLLFPDGPATKLVTAQYNSAKKTYELWSERPQIVNVPLKNGVRLATLDLDSTGRMWVAADSTTTIDLYYSDPEDHYSTWKGPVTIGSGVMDGDIAVVTTLRNGSIGVLWSNQVADRFYFREHKDLNAQGQRNAANDWESIELVAGEAAINVGGGMADDHLNVAVAADGTLYAGVKTSYDRSGYTMIGALVRRPNGVWDPTLYHASFNGTRPIIVLNEAIGQLMIFYDNVYHVSSIDQISFSSAKSVPLGGNVTSSKENWTNELVVLGGSKAVKLKTDAVSGTAPVANNDSFSIDEDTLLTVTAANGVLKNDSDADGDKLTAQLASQASHGTVQLNADGSFTYQPHVNYSGSDSFSYLARDGVRSSSAATVTIEVKPKNDRPTAEADSYSTAVDQTLVVAVNQGLLQNDSDPDADPLTAVIDTSPAHGTLSVFSSNGSFTYVPHAGFVGTDSFTYRSQDDVSASDVVQVSITVGVIATPVTITLQHGLDGYAGATDTRIRGDQTTTNYGQNSKLELDGSPDQVSLLRWDMTGIPVTSTVSEVTLSVNVVNTSTQDFEIYEALRAWDEMTATFLLAATNQAWQTPGAAGATDRGTQPLAALTSPTTGWITIPLNADGIAVVQKWVSDPATNHGFVIQDLANATTDDLDFYSREQSGQAPKLTITYSSSPPSPPPPPPSDNAAPEARPDAYSVIEDSEINISASLGLLFNDSDADGDTLEVELVSGPSSGQLELNADGSFGYRPNVDFNGTDAFSYRAVDSAGNRSQTTTVNLAVHPLNDPPVAAAKTVSTIENTLIPIVLSASDVDGDKLSYVVDTGPSHGTLTGTAPALTYTPAPGFSGTDSFVFHVHDGAASSNSATVTIEVAPASLPETWSFQDGLFPSASYSGTQDTAVRGDDAATNFGTRTALWLDGSPDQAAFIRWELTALPAGTIVHSATITLNVVVTSLDDYDIYEVLKPWTEMEATYNVSNANVPWQTAGAQGTSDRASTSLGKVTGVELGQIVVQLNAAGIAAVQRWVNSPAANYGIVIQDYANANTDDLDFSSSESKAAITRPKLTLDVTLPTASPKTLLAGNALRNQSNPYDVDANGVVTSGDVLIVFNALNRMRAAEGEPVAGSTTFPDVSGDGIISPLDALLVLNFLNGSLGAESEAVGAIALDSTDTTESECAFPRQKAPPALLFSELVPHADVSPLTAHDSTSGSHGPRAFIHGPSPDSDELESILDDLL